MFLLTYFYLGLLSLYYVIRQLVIMFFKVVIQRLSWTKQNWVQFHATGDRLILSLTTTSVVIKDVRFENKDKHKDS